MSSAPCRRWTRPATCWLRCLPSRARSASRTGPRCSPRPAVPREAIERSRVGCGGVRLAPAAHLPGPVRAHAGAGTLLREDPARARVVARRAARHFRSPGSPVLATRADAVASVAEIADGRRPGLLSRPRRRPSSVSPARHGHRATPRSLALQAARLSRRTAGDLDDARARIDKVRVDEDSPVATRLLWREVRVRAAPMRGATIGTRATTSAPGSPTCTRGSRRSAASTSRAPSSGMAAPWRSRGSGSRSTEGSPALAYEWSERARALVARVTPVRPPADEQQAGLLTELRVLYAADPVAALCRRPPSRPAARPDP